MGMQKSPHTQSQQNTHFAQTDADANRPEQTLGIGKDALMYEIADGAQTGTARSPRRMPRSANPPNVEPAAAAYEGGLRSRVFNDPDKQGISSRASSAERDGQRKVVRQRYDARAGLDHSAIKPR